MAQEVAKNQEIEKYGAYGSKLSVTFYFQLAADEHFTQVIIRHGYIVDSIGFEVANKRDGRRYPLAFGGNGGSESKIQLAEGEYLTGVSGTYGNYKNQNNEIVVAKLKVHSNLNPGGYGPFGLAKDVENPVDFCSPISKEYNMFGVFGRHNNYVQSIGALLKMEIPPFPQCN